MSGVETQHVLTRSRVRTVAERNDVSESTVWRLIRAGKLTAHRVGRRITLIDDAEADRVFGGAPQATSVGVRKVSA
jgi:excisionase family DNA binding protein